MTTPDDIQHCSLIELGRQLRSAALDARDLTEHYIRRIEAHPDAGVFISRCFDSARQAAQASAARLKAGKPASPWDGVPIVWKDNIDVMGVPTSVGSALFRDAPPAPADATVAAHARAGGMVTLAKANLSEFAYTALGLNPHYGTPRNPNATDMPRAPGGSSSGSGVAVAAGLAPVAIGTDTGGSVRTPAAFNGIVGFKPSAGRYDMRGVFPLSHTLDTVGFFVRHAADCWGMDCMLRGVPIEEGAPAPAAHALAGLAVLVPENVVLDELEPGVAENFENAILRLRDAGVRVQRRVVPELTELRDLIQRYGALASAEAYATHKALVDSDRFAALDPFVGKRILAGKTMSAADIEALQRGRHRLSASLWAGMSKNGLIAMPTVPHVAPPLSELQASQAHFSDVNSRTIRNTSLGNMLDLCGLSLPSGRGAAGMPTGILFSAASGSEPRLLGVAAGLAAALLA
jgi:aspartyl-tRNA(Asn)/glutamyl-tRNA(Gln) amidotransferase subunit A